MLIITHKPENLSLIGAFNNYAFGIAISDKNKYIIYRKCVFDVGEWEIFYEIEFRKLITVCPCNDNIPVAAGIVHNKLWILAQMYTYIASSGTPFKDCYQICTIDLETVKFELYKILNFRDFMNFNTPFCFKCYLLQITHFYNPNNVKKDDEKILRFMVCPNRIPLNIQNNPNLFNINNFYFEIDESKMTCKFGNFDENYVNEYSICAVSFIDENNGEYPNICRLQSRGRNSTDFKIIHQIEPFRIIFQSFFRDQNGQLFCLMKKRVSFENDDILILIKLIFDFVQKVVWFEEITNFHSVSKIYYPENVSIFIDNNTVVYQTPSTLIVLINRVLTLSEIAYLSLQKILPPSPVKQKKTFSKKFKSFFKKEQNSFYNPKIHGIWMSQKCLHNYFGIPLNVKIRHC